MDKGEGLEQKSNDWERVERKHIDWGHIRKCWGRLWESKKKKKKEKKRKKKIGKNKKLKLPSLEDKSKIKEGERLSSLWRAKEISIKERHNKSQ
jgi:Ni/Co efflux regulator RcnB